MSETIERDGLGLPRDADDLLDAVPVGVLVTDEHGRVVSANQEWSNLSGLHVADSLGDGWWAVLDRADRLQLRAGLERVLDGGDDVRGDYGLVAEPRRWLRWRIRERHPAGSGLVMAVMDVTADRDREADLSHRATHDGLTGLFTREEFLGFVDRALRRRERHPGEVVVVFVDLDDFKVVNDRGGHLLGDRVLAAAARRLREAVRPQDVVARVGGDEFSVLCGDLVDPADAVTLSERIRTALGAPFEVDGQVWTLGATVGVAVADQAEQSPEAVIGAADRAMYEGKRADRGSGHRTANRATASEAHRRPVPSPDGPSASWAADALIRQVFAAGLELAATLEVVDGRAAGRIEEALDILDRVVRSVHISGLDHVSPGPSSAGIDAVAGALQYAARRIDELATTEPAGQRALPLLDASHSTHRALLALDHAERSGDSPLGRRARRGAGRS